MPQNTIWFNEVDREDIKLVGGKGANLGEMTKAGFPVPNGFIVTSHAYFQFIKENGLDLKISHLLKTINFNQPHSIKQVSEVIRKIIIDSEMSSEIKLEIYSAYKKLGKNVYVAVRSSATAEDLPSASFAGQQETFLNVIGESNLYIKVKECWASLFTERAIFYRHENNFEHKTIGIAVPVQKMVNSEKSGVMFTIDPISNDKSKIIIESIYGLGEFIVQGIARPDHYEVAKMPEKIILKEISIQEKLLKKSNGKNKESRVSLFSKHKQKISDEQIVDLARIGKKLEKHYFFPQDVEWAIEDGKIYIVQTRPITTIKDNQIKEKPKQISFGELILKGDGASPGVISGHVRILSSSNEIKNLLPGEILVTEQTNPDFVPAMKIAGAIITDTGGRTSHAAIVSRELGIPAIVGSEKATKILKDGMLVTVNGTTGEIYRGGTGKNSFTVSKSIPNEEMVQTATKVYMNLAEPEIAQREAHRPSDGIGLLRAEFMMAGIGVHPKKMIRDGKKKEYIEKLAEGIEKFCLAMGDRPVIYRTSDFKTNEYRNLTGGKEFEPEEPNPMLGFRGSFRYIHDSEVFKLELEAIKYLRNKKGYKNLWIMLPFVRTPKELEEVKRIISSCGLQRSASFKLWMMVEIPSNVILLEKFIEIGIDGVSIGTNDLTMLILGTDRDNNEVAREFDETNEAVLWAISETIKKAGKHNITSSICGQAGSNPKVLEVAIKAGVTSVSVTPDLVFPTRQIIHDLEEKIFKN